MAEPELVEADTPPGHKDDVLEELVE